MSARTERTWLRQLLDDRRMTQLELARRLGWDKSVVSRLVFGQRQITIEDLNPLSRVLDVSPLDILAHEEVDGAMAAAASDTPFAKVPEIEVRAGMGGGGIAGEVVTTDEHGNQISADEVRDNWGLPPAYIHGELRLKPEKVRIIEVQGDSMEPTLRPGDRVMVNTGDRRPSPPGLFCLWDGYGVVVKRVEPIMDFNQPMLRIISDNENHRPVELTPEEVMLIGRVVWFARRI